MYSGLSLSENTLKKVLNIKLYFEGPSDWSIREYIEVIDEYLMERLPVILNNVLEPYGLEASILKDEEACRVLGEHECSSRIVVAIYDGEGGHVLFYVVYRRVVGDNTFEFQLEKLISTG